MIKNIVFDLGRVMVEFDPPRYLRECGFPEEMCKTLNTVIFDSEDWLESDRGTYPHFSDLMLAIIKKHPALETEIRRVFGPEMVHMHRLKKDSAAYMEELKARGYRIYILSNLSADSYAYLSGFDFMKLTDGAVYSYAVRSLKPEDGIYRALLDTYALVPEETIFFDDNAANIDAALRFGIHGIRFTSLEKAKKEAEALLAEKQ